MAPVLTPILQDEFVAAVHTLAAKIAGDGWAPHFIIGVGRGGLVPGAFLSHATGLPLLSVDYSAQVPDFSDDLLVKLAERTRTGERLLIVDDFNDTGRTIKHLRAALADAEAVPGSVRFATLVDNIRSAERVDYWARQIDRDVTKDWFVFPWEAVATRAAIAEDASAVPERTA